MKGVQAVAQILQQEGVEYLFSYPNHPLIDAAAAIGIRPIIARTEKTLVNMADGFSRVSNGRRLGVCVVQAGPGIENAYGGVAQAFADGIPLLLLPGGPDQGRLGARGEFDPVVNYRPITQWAARINCVERIPLMVRRAFTLLRSGQPGPVLLELPADVAAAPIDVAEMGYTPARAYRPSGDPTDVATAVRLLLAARRPLIHAGHGVLWAEAWEELRELAELLQAPVMTTMAGKSAFPEDHPLAAGTGGQTLARAAAHCLAHADLILGIGASFATPFTATPIPPGKVLIQVTLDVRDIDRDYPVDHAIIGDARLVLRQLISELGRLRGSSGRRDGTEVIAEIRAAREVERREWLPRLTSEEIPINPYRVIWELMHAVDRRTTIVTHDSGNPRDQTLTFYEAIAPRGYLGWGKSTQLGTGLGLALGAKLSQPGKTVVNLMGDLAFGTAAIEVETAVRERIPILTIVLNNSGLGGYHHHMPIASDRYACNVLSGRYMEVAVGLGAYSERVEDPAQIAPAISRGLAATYEGRPAVLEMITKEEPVYPLAHQVLATIRETASV